jgi:HEAT repeat protein
VPALVWLVRFVVVAAATLLRSFGDRGWIERPAGNRLPFWRSAAQAVRLTSVEEARSTLAGWAGNLHVRLSRYEDARACGTRVTISGPGVSKELTIRPQALGATVRGAPDDEIGDASFDSAAWVEGPPALARAVLDADTRRTLKGLLEGRLDQPGRPTFWASGALVRGVLLVDVPEITPGSRGTRADWLYAQVQDDTWDAGRHAVAGLDRLPEALKRVLELARRLAPPPDVPRRIADNLKTEPDGGVRLRLLTTLNREFADLPLTREALIAARDDPDAQVRLRTGIALGPAGTDVLVHLADGEGADDATTEMAVATLGERLTVAQALSILRGALRTRRSATARACIGALGARGGAEGATMLTKVLAVEGPELATAAATALADTHAASAEGPLLAALDNTDATVRLAAARALGRAGTVDAIASLKQAEAHDPPLRATARQAIATIQSRLPGAAPGQLSLAVADSGRLSLATEDGGQLSLPDEED